MWSRIKEIYRKIVGFIKSNSDTIELRVLQFTVVALGIAIIWEISATVIIFHTSPPMREILVVGQNDEILWKTYGRYNFKVGLDFISLVDEDGDSYKIAIDHYDYASIIVREMSEEALATATEFLSRKR